MKKYFFLTLLLATIAHSIDAQQNLFGGSPIISPEIHSDNTVTFRLLAPDAKVVKISGEWMPMQEWHLDFIFYKRWQS